MKSHVVTIAELMKDKKRIKTKIGLSSVVMAKVGEMEENTREEISSRISIDFMVFVQDMVGNKKFLVQFEDRQNK